MQLDLNHCNETNSWNTASYAAAAQYTATASAYLHSTCSVAANFPSSTGYPSVEIPSLLDGTPNNGKIHNQLLVLSIMFTIRTIIWMSKLFIAAAAFSIYK